MTYVARSAAPEVARRSVLRTGISVITTVLCVAGLLLLLEAAVSEPGAGVGVAPAPVAAPALPYGGQLDLPDPDDALEPGALMGLGLLVLGLANGLVFAGSAALDSMISPSAAETRRRLRQRSGRGAVPGGHREVRRTIAAPAAAPAASATPAVDDVFARRSAPGRPAIGTTYAPVPAHAVPAPRRPAPVPAPAPAPVPAAVPAPEPVPEPVSAPIPVPAPRRPSPVPRDGGHGTPRSTRRGTGPWGWRPARPDPVPWRNPVPALVG